MLSGGDPLSLATPKLAELTDALAAMPHLKRLRDPHAPADRAARPRRRGPARLAARRCPGR